MIFTSESYSPYSFVRKVGVKIRIMPAGTKNTDPDSTAELVIDTQDVISMTINESIDICAENFKPRSMVLNLINTSRLSVLNDLTGREIRAAAVVGGEEVNVGRFYIDRVVFVDCGLTARIIASDTVTRLSRLMTGLYFSDCTTLFNALSSGSGAADGLDFETDSTVGMALVCPNMLTEIDSASNCLLRLAQAARSSAIWVDRRMKVRFACVVHNETVVGEIPADSIIRQKSEVLNRRTDLVLVYGKNKYGSMSHTAGRLVNDYLMESVHNDFLYTSELELTAQNRLKEANFRYRLTLLTRCNPAIEVGDLLRIGTTDGSTPQELLVIGQKIVFDKNGLTSEMELAGYRE